MNDARCVLVPVRWDATKPSENKNVYFSSDRIVKAMMEINTFDVERSEDLITKHGLIDTQRIEEDVALKNSIPFQREQSNIPVDVINNASALLNVQVENRVKTLIKKNKITGTIGGEHSVSLGSIKAHAGVYEDLYVLHIDARPDVCVSPIGIKYSHESIMKNVLEETQVAGLIQLGIRDMSIDEYQTLKKHKNIVTFYDTCDCPINDNTYITHEIIKAATGGRGFSHKKPNIYISLDVRGLEPNLCPGIKNVVPGGISWYRFCKLMLELPLRANIVGFDFVEVPNKVRDIAIASHCIAKLFSACLASL